MTAHRKAGQLIIVGRLKKRARLDIAEASAPQRVAESPTGAAWPPPEA
jgi:hypothetical protein